MDSATIRKQCIQFFAGQGHTIVPSSSLVPSDPSVLLTTAGMQQFKPYYTGEADPEKDFGSKNTASIQKSFRTSDIDEVGDETHLTFFEMVGNFSFGGYFKEETIKLAHEFITKVMELPISYVTIFKGSDMVPKDEESRQIWNSLGVNDVREEDIQDVFWGPTGNSGPCGPTTEIYCKNAAGKDVEIWNCVFNQFFYPGSREELLAGTPGKELEPLTTPGVDTGMGLERLAMISQNAKNIFDTDLFHPLIQSLPAGVDPRKKRIIADHVRGIVFLLADGVRPSNKGAGYILRRLARRVMVYEKTEIIPAHVIQSMVHEVIHDYGEFYPELLKEADVIRTEIEAERGKFGKTLERGMKELEKIGQISVSDAFRLYETYGLPYEVIKEIGGEKTDDVTREGFDAEFLKHQEISRAGVEKKFGGHGLLLDTGELKAGSEEELKIVTRLHTATHLLNAALRKVLGDSVEQRGSDITAERTRFDFLFPRKLTSDEIAKVEELVNYAIQKDFLMTIQELPLDEAKKSGALFFYKGHYPERVKVYTVGNEFETFSKELCGGPHVARTSEIGKFKIVKEEASSAGVRRIRAIVL
ncbi:MAG: alanine--tRNA ligase [Candidatus Sungbacteria bacterium]|uniref:alanine--tRNA ligase n=1 Tax=Candidatus Sungiibacteriota bacterium TaxID=2750080 RepID=A0A9D6LUK5_9BACT|nr:alanine--tRNA ligase [Candidatus Sungbacteria bacterium]